MSSVAHFGETVMMRACGSFLNSLFNGNYGRVQVETSSSINEDGVSWFTVSMKTELGVFVPYKIGSPIFTRDAIAAFSRALASELLAIGLSEKDVERTISFVTGAVDLQVDLDHVFPKDPVQFHFKTESGEVKMFDPLLHKDTVIADPDTGEADISLFSEEIDGDDGEGTLDEYPENMDDFEMYYMDPKWSFSPPNKKPVVLFTFNLKEQAPSVEGEVRD